MVIGLADGILGGEPQILLDTQGILEAGVGERCDGCVQVVHALQDARALELEDRLANLLTVLAGEDKLCLASAGPS